MDTLKEFVLKVRKKMNVLFHWRNYQKWQMAHLKNKFVHFSSCRTMLGIENSLEQFKINTGAAYISGYTTSVNGVLSAINDIAYFDRIFRYQKKKALVKSAMDKYYQGLCKKLGFKIL